MRLQTLSLKNFMSHGETSLDFTGIPSAILTGPNGAGKSTLIDAVAWALWGETRAGTDDVVRLGQTECAVTATFGLSGATYRVTRSRRVNGSGGKPSLDFEVEDAANESGWRSLAGANIRDTQARIEALVGPFDLACATWLSRQGQADQFARATAGERRQVLGRLLNLERWGRLATASREMARGETAKAEARDATRAPLAEVASTLGGRTEALGALRLQAQIAAGRQADAESELQAASDRLAALHVEHATIREARARHEAKAAEVAAAEARVAERRQALQDVEDQIDLLDSTGDGWTTEDDAALGAARATEDQATADMDTARARGEVAAESKRGAEKALDDAERAIRDANAEAAGAWDRRCADRAMDLKRAEVEVLVASQAVTEAERAVEAARGRAREEWQGRRAEAQVAWGAAEREAVAAQTAVRDAERAIEDARKAAADAWRAAVSKADGDVLRAEATATQASLAHDQAVREASLLDGVPCGGRPEFAGCQFLRNAIAKRNSLGDLAATANTCISAAVHANDARDALGTEAPPPPPEVLGPLQAALATAQAAADAAGQAHASAVAARDALGVTPPDPSPDVLGPLQDRVNEAAATKTGREMEASRAKAALQALGTVAPGVAPEVLAPLENALADARGRLATARGDHARAAADYVTAKARLDAARADRTALEAKRAGAEASVQQLADARARAAALRDEVQRLAEEAARLASDRDALQAPGFYARDLDAEVRSAKDRVTTATTSRDLQVHVVAQAEAQVREASRLVAEAEKAAADLATLDAEIATIRAKAADLTTLAQAYADVPQLVVEGIVPDIEGTANHLLAKVSQTGLSISIRTQRALKSEKDRLAETLDLVVRDSVGERPYETYSGGERFRVDLALRFALAAVLSARAGVPLETICIDEGFGSLDSPGVAAFSSTLGVMAEMVDLCLVISHVDAMFDAFSHRIEVAKGASGSVARWVQ